MPELMRATARAHANIAFVKYWGKRDAALNLPAAGSLSVTLAGLSTTTEVAFGGAGVDALVVDGEEQGPRPLRKALRVVEEVRACAGDAARAPVLITSRNDFPTGAGLASSASGLAALALAAARAAGLALTPQELSVLARRGSGSACRSIFGGYVQWDAGAAADGSDSHARQLHPPEHWDLRCVVAVVSDRPKAVDSTRGMIATGAQSPFFGAFVAQVEPDLAAARAAIAGRDLEGLARVAERSCLRMHAAMMAGDPALIYLAPESWQVINLARRLREEGLALLFTADAGPNVKLFCAPADEAALASAVEAQGCARRVIHARPGPGAEVVAS